MASRFWLGGTGNWDGTTASSAHWGTGSGTGGPASGPGVNDTATFDANSGGGTVTITGNITVQSITCGAFTGTLDFSANNNNVTLTAAAGFNASGTGTRTINLGNGIWTLTAPAGWTLSTITNLTFNANSSTIAFSGATASARNFLMGNALTYSTVSFGANSSGGYITLTGNGATIGTLSISGQNAIAFRDGTTLTVTNAFAWAGSSASPLYLFSDSLGTAATIAAAAGSTISWAGIRDMTFTGSPTATNSLDLGHNSGITITAPSAAGMLVHPGMSGGMRG